VNDEKYIGLDVHQATIVVAVMDWRFFTNYLSSLYKIAHSYCAECPHNRRS